MFQCLSQRDNANNFFSRLRIDNYNNKILEEADAYKPIFILILTGLEKREHWRGKYFLRIGKI